MKLVITGSANVNKADICNRMTADNGVAVAKPKPVENQKPEDILFRFTANGTDYAFEKADVETADAILIHPDNIDALIEAMPDEDLMLVNISCNDDDARNQIAIERHPDNPKIIKEIEAENSRRLKTIQAIREEADNGRKGNLRVIGDISHSLTDRSEKNIATALSEHIHLAKNLINIILTMGMHDEFDVQDDQVLILDNSTGKKTMTRIAVAAEMAIMSSHQTKDYASNLVMLWLRHPETIIPPPENPDEDESEEEPEGEPE